MNKSKIYSISISICAVFVSFLINSSYAQSDITNQYFSIKIPDNWTYVEVSNTIEAKNRGFGPVNSIELTPSEFSDILTSHDFEKDIQKGPYAIILQDTDYPKNAPLESYVKNKIDKYGIQNITSQRHTTVGNEKSIRLYANQSASFGDSKIGLYFVMHDKEPYLMGYTANAKNYEKYLPDFEQMVKSFKFVGSPSSKIENLSEYESQTNARTNFSSANTSDKTYLKFTNELDQQNKEKFLELGEEQFRKDCYKNLNQDNEVAEDLLDYMPEDLTKDICENKISKIKNETAALQQNQTLDSATGEATYTTHNDYSNGFTIEYPTDWHVSSNGEKIFKGTREFTMSKFDDPQYSILDTNSFGNIIFDVWKDKDGAKITDDLGQINIGDKPAASFSYSQLGKEFMVVALMHNNVGYVFEYGTLKENFDKDFDTMMHFFGTLRLT